MYHREGEKLTAKHERALAALLTEPSPAKAAEACGIPLRTLNRWISDPVFGDEYRRLRRETFAHSVSMAQKYAPMALNTLASISMDKSAPHSSRVSASKAVLDYGRESIELDDVVQRVAKLEESARAAERHHSGRVYGGEP